MIEIYDNGGETFDRYTVIVGKDVYGSGERVTIESLPETVQRAIEYRRRP